MTNAEALRRAKRAIRKAHKSSRAFEDGSMASWDIVQLLDEAMAKEFAESASSTKPISARNES